MKVVIQEIVNQNRDNNDKDMIIADLTNQLANAQQQINDLNSLMADLQIKIGGRK